MSVRFAAYCIVLYSLWASIPGTNVAKASMMKTAPMGYGSRIRKGTRGRLMATNNLVKADQVRTGRWYLQPAKPALTKSGRLSNPARFQ